MPDEDYTEETIITEGGEVVVRHHKAWGDISVNTGDDGVFLTADEALKLADILREMAAKTGGAPQNAG